MHPAVFSPMANNKLSAFRADAVVGSKSFPRWFAFPSFLDFLPSSVVVLKSNHPDGFRAICAPTALLNNRRGVVVGQYPVEPAACYYNSCKLPCPFHVDTLATPSARKGFKRAPYPLQQTRASLRQLCAIGSLWEVCP